MFEQYIISHSSPRDIMPFSISFKKNYIILQELTLVSNLIDVVLELQCHLICIMSVIIILVHAIICALLFDLQIAILNSLDAKS